MDNLKLDQILDAIASFDDPETIKYRTEFCVRVKVMRDILREIYKINVSGYGTYNETETELLIDAFCRTCIFGALMVPPPMYELVLAGIANIYRGLWKAKTDTNPDLKQDSIEQMIAQLSEMFQKINKNRSAPN